MSLCEENNYDMSAINWLEYNLTISQVENILDGNTARFNPPNDDSFGDNLSSTNRWLLSIATSYVMSVFVTGPLTAFFMQLKTVLFHKHGDLDEVHFFSLYLHFV